MSDPSQSKQSQSRFTIRTKSNSSSDVQYYVPQTNVARSGRAAAEAAATEAFNARVKAFCDQQSVKDIAKKSFDDALAEVTRRQNARIQRYNEQKKRGPPVEPMPYTGPVSAPFKFRAESDLLPSERKEWRADAFVRTPINSVFTELRLASLFSVPYKTAGQPTMLHLPSDEDRSRENVDTIPYTYMDMREKQNWDFANKRLAEGMEYVEQKSFQAALDRFKMAVDMQPKCAEAYFRASEIFFEMKNLKDAFETADRALKADPSHQPARHLWHKVKDALKPPSKSKSRESRSGSSRSDTKRHSSSSRLDDHSARKSKESSSRSKDSRDRGRSSQSRRTASPARDAPPSSVLPAPKPDTARVYAKSPEDFHHRSDSMHPDYQSERRHHRVRHEQSSSQQMSIHEQTSGHSAAEEGQRRNERVDVGGVHPSRMPNLDQEQHRHIHRHHSSQESKAGEDGEIIEKSSEKHRDKESRHSDIRKTGEHRESRHRHRDSRAERNIPEKDASMDMHKRDEHAALESRERHHERRDSNTRKDMASAEEARRRRDDHSKREAYRHRHDDRERSRRDIPRDHHLTEEATHKAGDTRDRRRKTHDYDAPRKDHGTQITHPRDDGKSLESRDRPRQKHERGSRIKEQPKADRTPKEEPRRRNNRSPRDRGDYHDHRREDTIRGAQTEENEVRRRGDRPAIESQDRHKAQNRQDEPVEVMSAKEHDAKPKELIDLPRNSNDGHDKAQEHHDLDTKDTQTGAEEKASNDRSLASKRKRREMHDDYGTTTENIPKKENEHLLRDDARKEDQNLLSESKDTQPQTRERLDAAARDISKKEEYGAGSKKEDDTQGLKISTDVTRGEGEEVHEHRAGASSDVKKQSENDLEMQSQSAPSGGELRIRGIAPSSAPLEIAGTSKATGRQKEVAEPAGKSPLKIAGESKATTDANNAKPPAQERSPRQLGSVGKAGFMTSLKRSNSGLRVADASIRSSQAETEEKVKEEVEDHQDKRRRVASGDSDLTQEEGKSQLRGPSSGIHLYDPRKAGKRWRERKQTELERDRSEPRSESQDEPNSRDNRQGSKRRSQDQDQRRHIEFLNDSRRGYEPHGTKKRRRK